MLSTVLILDQIGSCRLFWRFHPIVNLIGVHVASMKKNTVLACFTWISYLMTGSGVVLTYLSTLDAVHSQRSTRDAVLSMTSFAYVLTPRLPCGATFQRQCDRDGCPKEIIPVYRLVTAMRAIFKPRVERMFPDYRHSYHLFISLSLEQSNHEFQNWSMQANQVFLRFDPKFNGRNAIQYICLLT